MGSKKDQSEYKLSEFEDQTGIVDHALNHIIKVTRHYESWI